MRLERSFRSIGIFPYMQGAPLSPLLEKNAELAHWPSHVPQDFGIWSSEKSDEDWPAVLKIWANVKAVFVDQKVQVQVSVDGHPQESLQLYSSEARKLLPCHAIQLFLSKGPENPQQSLKIRGEPLLEGQLLHEKTFLTQKSGRLNLAYERRSETSLWVMPPGRENTRVYWGYGGVFPFESVDSPSLFLMEQVFFSPFYHQGKTIIQSVFGKGVETLEGFSPFFMDEGPEGRVTCLAEDIQQGLVCITLCAGFDSTGHDVSRSYKSFDLKTLAQDRCEIHFQKEL